MIALLLTALFSLSAVLAVWAMAISWRQYGPAVLAIRQQLRDCPPMREVRHRVIEVKVRSAGATIYRPAFRMAAPLPRSAWRAAA